MPPVPGPGPPAWPDRRTARTRRASTKGGHARAGRGRPPPPTRPRPRRATVPGGSSGVWSRNPVRTPRPCRTTPASGSSRPARTRSSVDLPVPLMPTTPSRSPVGTVTDRSPNRMRSAMVTLTPWRSTSTLTGHTVLPDRRCPGGAERPDGSGSAGRGRPPTGGSLGQIDRNVASASDDEESRCSDC